ncbi:hypothetical protein [Cellulophaga sp. Z1A5H]|uniref:hypothetical protein n=1 Tax=Cellulophaga sp. Z1A5H TaxID=2687291 RepID=UPI0013FD2941|nr:hypothetical protein [Cellulophaga sp. Z1A5H]
MTYIVPLLIMVAIGAYFLYMKKTGKFDALGNSYLEAEKEATEKFDEFFQEFKADEQTFKPIVAIIGGDFSAIGACKKPKSILGAAADTAKTMLTGVVVENTNHHLLVLQDEKLHYIEYNSNSKTASTHWEFDKRSISNLEFEKGKLTDNLKQSMSFQLRGGGESGDATKNSDLHKLSFESKEKKYSFFVYTMIGFGAGFEIENPIGNLSMKQTTDDILRGTLLPLKFGELFFEKIKAFK